MTQRTDSTHVLAAVRDLTRLELITEAIRAALEELASTAPHLLADVMDQEWGRRYGRPVRLGRNPTKPNRLRSRSTCDTSSAPVSGRVRSRGAVAPAGSG